MQSKKSHRGVHISFCVFPNHCRWVSLQRTEQWNPGRAAVLFMHLYPVCDLTLSKVLSFENLPSREFGHRCLSGKHSVIVSWNSRLADFDHPRCCITNAMKYYLPVACGRWWSDLRKGMSLKLSILHLCKHGCCRLLASAVGFCTGMLVPFPSASCCSCE